MFRNQFKYNFDFDTVMTTTTTTTVMMRPFLASPVDSTLLLLRRLVHETETGLVRRRYSGVRRSPASPRRSIRTTITTSSGSGSGSMFQQHHPLPNAVSTVSWWEPPPSSSSCSALGRHCFSSNAAGANNDNINDERHHCSSSESARTTTDYFQLLGVPRLFALPPGVLDQRYKQLMRTHHPDLTQHHQPQQSDETTTTTTSPSTTSPITASQITHAHSILKQPHLRAAHLLALRLNHTQSFLEQDDDSTTSTTRLQHDDLMEIMEIRQAIEDMNDTTTTDKALLQQYQMENDERMQEIYRQLTELLDRPTTNHNKDDDDDDDEPPPQDLEEAQRLTALLRYWVRVQETLRDKME